MADLPELYQRVAAAQGMGLPASTGTGMESMPSTGPRFGLDDAFRLGIGSSLINQGPLASQTSQLEPQAVEQPASMTGSSLGDVGMALAMMGSGLRGDILPGVAVFQQLEQRKAQAAAIVEKKRQQEEAKRQHDMGMVERILSNTTLPNSAKLDALDKMRRDIPWAGTMADGLKEAHLQNFKALRAYIPEDVVSRVVGGESSAGEISAWADFAQESYKVDLKERIREQAYTAAAQAPEDQRTPSQQKLIQEREADLAVKTAKAEADTAQAALHRAQAAQPQGVNKKLEEFKGDLLSAGIDPKSKEGQNLLRVRAEREAKGTPMVNIDMGQDASKEAQKKFMDKASETYQQLKTAPVQLKNLEEAKALIPKARGFMGPFGETKLEVTKFLNNSLGLNVNPEGVNSAEELRTRIFQNVLENLKKMDAQPSQYQQIIMMESLGKLGTDPNALTGVIDAYGDIIRGRVDLYNKEVKSAEQRGVKFPYDPIIKLEQSEPKPPSKKDMNERFKRLNEIMK